MIKRTLPAPLFAAIVSYYSNELLHKFPQLPYLVFLTGYSRGDKHVARRQNVARARILCHNANAWSPKLFYESGVKMADYF